MTTVTAQTAAGLTLEELEAILATKKAEENEKRSKERESYEHIKETTIINLATEAMAFHEQLKAFKERAFDEAETLYKLLQQYSKRHADGKGSYSVKTADGSIEMSFKKQLVNRFDERSIQAEKHIIDFVNDQFKGDEKTQKLITNLLERTRGSLDVRLIQKLYKMENDYDHPNWIEGIRLLKESYNADRTKDYLSFVVNGKAVVLDFASI